MFLNIPQPGRDPRVSKFFGLPVSKSNSPIVGWRTWKIGKFSKFVRKDNPLIECEIVEGGYFPKGTIDLDWRRIESRSYYLAPAHVGGIWEGPVMTTNVLPNGRLSPVSLVNKATFGIEGRGDYGVYSYKNLPELVSHHGILEYRIFGKVDNVGQVIEHEFGYRAQKSIIRELWLLGFVIERIEHIHMKDSLEERYQCPVNVFEKEAELLHFERELNSNV